MAKSKTYDELDFRDAIISVYLTDTWIGSQIADLENNKSIQGLSLLEFTVPWYPAISVELMSREDTKYIQDFFLVEEADIPYRVDIARQDMDRQACYDAAFKLAKDCKITIENNRNLNFKCDYLEVSDIINTNYREKAEWTFVFTFFIAVKNYVSLLQDHQ